MAAPQPDNFKFDITADGETTTLQTSPVGWDQTTVTIERNATFWGIDRSLTVPFSFVKEGARILRRMNYKYGVVALAKLAVAKLNPKTWQHIGIFKGKFDFTTFKERGDTADCNLTEDSLTVKIAAFKDVKYQIPIDVPEKVLVELTPIPFKEKAQMIFVQTKFETDSDNYFPEISIVTNEIHAINATVKNVTAETTNTPNLSTDGSYFLNAQKDTIVRGTLRIYGIVVVFGPTSTSQIIIVNNSGVVRQVITEITQGGGSSGFDVTINLNLPVVFGEKLFVYVRRITNNMSITVGGGDLNLAYETQSPPTTCNALRSQYLYNELIQQMNGKGDGGAYTPYPTSSLLLTGVFKDVVYTCSNSIRKIVNGQQYNPGDSLLAGAKYLVQNDTVVYNGVNYAINQQFTAIPEVETFASVNGYVLLLSYAEYIVTSFSDFFQDMVSMNGGQVAFGIENDVANLDDMANFFRPNTLIDCGTEITKPEFSNAIDKMYNTIVCGYENQQYDTLNGLQEVNNSQQYITDITSPSKELNLKSPYRSDPIGIETLRFTPQDTSASRSDNDVFKIWLKPAAEPGRDYYHPLRTEGLQSITGVDNPSAYYNWELTPKRCLLRGSRYLASIFYNMQGYQIRFKSADKNFNLVTVDNDGVRVAERDDIEISSLGPAIFVPIYINFSVGLKQDALNSINIGYGQIKFIDERGKTYSGYIEAISVDTAQNTSRDFKLLGSTTYDFKQRIF